MSKSKKTLCFFVRGWTDGDEWPVKLTTPKKRKADPNREPGAWPSASLHNLLTTGGAQESLELRYPTFGRPQNYLTDEKDRKLDRNSPVIDMSLWSADDPHDIANEIRRAIDHYYDPERHDRLVLIGYSAGGALLRYAIMLCYGIAPDTNEREGEVSQWVTDKLPMRAVYLAGILRGWSVSTAMPTFMRIFAGPLTLLANSAALLRRRKRAFIYKMRHGEPFVVRGRLMQASLRARANDVELPFEQIDVLGTLDNIIAPKDCIELSGSKGQIFIEMPKTDHAKMLEVDLPDTDADTELSIKAIRGRLILKAVLDELSSWQDEAQYVVSKNDINDYFDHLDRPQITAFSETDASNVKDKPSAQVTHAVFVLHGIRDNGHWTKRVARQIKMKANSPLVRAPSPTYGFFNMISFVAPWVRYEKARWFMEEYADVRECYPKADVSFVGHSNGTYLAARAMDECDLVQFKRIVFAGSVVRRAYPWNTRKEKSQLTEKALNLKGTFDWVVLFLPGVTEWWPLKYLDLGGAGFYGFKARGAEEYLIERFVHGDHGAGISERTWTHIADFVVEGKITDDLNDERDHKWVWLGRFAPLITLGSLFAAILLLWLLVYLLGCLMAPKLALWLLVLIAAFVVLRLA